MNLTPNEEKASKKIPLASYILLGLALVSLCILIISKISSQFALFFNKHVGGAVRAALAYVTNPFSFSVAELIVILIPVFITLIILYAVHSRSGDWRSVLSYIVVLISGASVIFTLFVFSFGTGYNTPTLYESFNVENNGVTVEELKSTAMILASETNEKAKQVKFMSDGFSKMPYSLDEMSNILVDAYESAEQKYDFIQNFSSRVKPVLLSVPMSYTHTTGIYSFFTGEANLNVDFPDYTLPYTAAHELAHQRGIARENEANFIAFLASIESKDAYVEYCAYINLFEYIAAALYLADSKAYIEVYEMLSPEVQGEMAAYSKFFDKYRNSKVSEISTALNDAYLIANGTPEGTKSYGLVVDLAVAYFSGEFAEK